MGPQVWLRGSRTHHRSWPTPLLLWEPEKIVGKEGRGTGCSGSLRPVGARREASGREAGKMGSHTGCCPLGQGPAIPIDSSPRIGVDKARVCPTSRQLLRSAYWDSQKGKVKLYLRGLEKSCCDPTPPLLRLFHQHTAN